jgi:precorrin-2 dehydrogenase
MFPIFLKLEGRRCLVVGAGTIAQGKIQGLLGDGAQVKVIAREAVPQIREWAASGVLAWEARAFEPKDLDGAFLVIVATSSREANTQVFEEANARHVLCNAVDDPERCDFYYPAVVKRGDLQIAISTSGRSPALAQRIRQELEQQFGLEYEAWVAELGLKRDQLNATQTDPEIRKRILHELASRRSFESRHPAQQGGGQ